MPILKETIATHVTLGTGTSAFTTNPGIKPGEEVYVIAAQIYIEAGTGTGLASMGVVTVDIRPKHGIIPITPFTGINQETVFHGHLLLGVGDIIRVAVLNSILNDQLFYSIVLERHLP